MSYTCECHERPLKATLDIDESRAVQRAREGDASAQRLLFDAHVHRVHALAFRMCGSEDMADDLTQDTFIRAFAQLPTFRGDAPFSAWLHRIAVSVILNGLRSRRRRETHEVPFELGATASLESPSNDPVLGEALNRAMDSLDVQGRLIVILHEIHGYTASDIAQMTGSLPGTVRVRLTRAKARLRKALRRYWEVT